MRSVDVALEMEKWAQASAATLACSSIYNATLNESGEPRVPIMVQKMSPLKTPWKAPLKTSLKTALAYCEKGTITVIGSHS